MGGAISYAPGRRRWFAFGGAFGALVVLTLIVLAFNSGSDTASAASSGPEMVLNIKGGNCDDPVRPTKCDVPTGGAFTLSVDALGIPAGGYDLIATAIDLGTNLIYTGSALAADDMLWPDAVFTTRATIGNALVHGALTGLIPPLPVSSYTGNLIEITLACPLSLNDSPVTLALLPLGDPVAGTSGAQFQRAGVSTIPKLSSLTISCLAPTPTPTDTPTPTFTPTPTDTPTPTTTPTPTITPTPTPCPTEGCPTPTFTPTPTPPLAADFVVDSTADISDISPGNGVCATAAGVCTLRAAVQEANALPGHQSIAVPAGTYFTHLTIKTDVTLSGAGSAATIVDGSGAGGVIWVSSGATVEISDLTIQNGSSGVSGGIFYGGTLTVSRITVIGNSATNTGGGIGDGGTHGTLTVNDSTITGNTAGNTGGGIRNSGTLIVNNSTITGNTAGNTGGGIRNSGSATINDSTITDNTAGNTGGGTGKATMKNTIVTGNSPNDCTSPVVSLGHNLDSDGSCGLAGVGDISNANPLLGPLADNGGPTFTQALLPGSPAIDAGGTDCPPPATDQRGSARGVDGNGDTVAACDIGAFERCPGSGCFLPTPGPTHTPGPSPTPTSTPDLTDTDGDGCPDQRENGLDEMLGGMRDWQNPNDFYDVLGGGGGPPDGVIDLPNDVLGVIQHFSPAGAPPYDVQFDRGPSSGPHPWNMTAPDGVIDLPNDILGVITQFDHDCR